MSVFTIAPPKINKNHLIFWMKENYSFLKNKKFNLSHLNSERDTNFLLTINNNSKFVIKISNTNESKKFLEMQDYVISSLNKKSLIKKFIPIKKHKSIKTYLDINQHKCFVRILTYIDGKMYAKYKNSNNLENSLGKTLGILSRSLQNLGHPSAYRHFEWNPSEIDWIKKYIYLFDNKHKKIILNNLYDYDKFIKKNKNNLRFSLTHGDINNYNLVVSNQNVVGLIDYGDMIYAPTINDLAICLAYALMNKKDLYTSLKNIILSYHKNFPITKHEIFSLITLVKCRLTITVTMSAKQKIKFPKNKYLTISEKDAWNLLYKLDKINPYIFIYLIRDICNFKIVDHYDESINFLKYNKFANIFDDNLENINKSIINLHSSSFFTKSNLNVKNNTEKIKKFLNKNNSEIGIGLYCEKRNVYKGNNFISLFDTKIKRNIHLGIDFFINSGTCIRAPLDGIVYILHNNSQKYDYGPTIVLKHQINPKIKFYTLYGHLSKKCLNKLSLGQKIKKGEIFSEIGNFSTNGNWPPHLHFQMCKLPDLS